MIRCNCSYCQSLREKQNPDREQKALQLLLEHLNEAQRRQLERWGYFETVGSLGNVFRLYLHGDIAVKNPMTARYDTMCTAVYVPQPMAREFGYEGLPQSDVTLTKKLIVESDEMYLWSVKHMRPANEWATHGYYP